MVEEAITADHRFEGARFVLSRSLQARWLASVRATAKASEVSENLGSLFHA
jgi:hypothetical protein